MQYKNGQFDQTLNRAERDLDGKTLKQIQQRNHQIMKDIEMMRAKLRSRALYSPLETILQDAIENYKSPMQNASSTSK